MIRTFSILLLNLLSLPVAAGVLTIVGFNVESDDASERVIASQLEQSSGIDLWGLSEVYHEGRWTSQLWKRPPSTRVRSSVRSLVPPGAVIGMRSSIVETGFVCLEARN